VNRPLRIRTLAAVALALALAAPYAAAQTKTGTTIGTFLEIEPSARVAGMGNAGAPLEDGIDAAYYNPAAVGRVDQYQLTFTHSLWLAGITYDYAAGAMPLGKWGKGFVTLTSLNSGDIDVRTVAQPLGTGERYSVNDLALGLGYGLAVTDRFTTGFQINLVQETIWHTSLSAATVSIGTLYRTSENGLRLGASLSNFGTQGRFSGRDLRITYDAQPNVNGDNSALPGEAFTDPYLVPVLFRVGVGKPFRVGTRQWLNVAVQAEHPNDNTESMSAGAEFDDRGVLALRVGYQNAFQQDSEVGLTAGGGLRGRLDVYQYRLDYAWADQGRLGSTHRITFGLAF
jgi:hypothetical protein